MDTNNQIHKTNSNRDNTTMSNNNNLTSSPSPLPSDLTSLPSALIGVVSPFDNPNPNASFARSKEASPWPYTDHATGTTSASSSHSYAAERAAYAAAGPEEKLHMDSEHLFEEIKSMRQELADMGGSDSGDGGSVASGGGVVVAGNGGGLGEGGNANGNAFVYEEDMVVAGENAEQRVGRLGMVVDRLWCRLRGLFENGSEDEDEEMADEAHDADNEETNDDGNSQAAAGGVAVYQASVAGAHRHAQYTGLSIDSDPNMPANYTAWLENRLREAEGDREKFLDQRDKLVEKHQQLKAKHAQAAHAWHESAAADKEKDGIIDAYKDIVDEWSNVFMYSEARNNALIGHIETKDATITALKTERVRFTYAVGRDLLRKWVPDEDYDEALGDLKEMIEYDEIRHAMPEQPPSDTPDGATTCTQNRGLPVAESQDLTKLEQEQTDHNSEIEKESPEIRELMMMGVRALMGLGWSLFVLLGWNPQ